MGDRSTLGSLRSTLAAVVFASLVPTACSSSPKTSSTDVAEPTDAETPDAAVDTFDGAADASDPPDLGLPRLPRGNHFGLWTSYESLPAGTAAAVDTKLAEARGNGMRISRVHMSWAELEAQPGTIDVSKLETALSTATSHGEAAHVLLETIDSDGFSLPSDLMGASQYTLADGRSFDDPVILGRFDALLDKVIPLLVAHRVFALSIGNEPDAFYDDVAPDSPAGQAWGASISSFLSKARTRIHSTVPEVAVAMTVRQGSLALDRQAALAPIVSAGDFAAFNYYCLTESYQVRPAGSVATDVGGMVAVAAGRPVVLQEVGCPSGRAPSVVGASSSAQSAFFAEVGQSLQKEAHLRAAFAFQLVDWSPALAKSFGDAYATQGFPELGAKVEETLASLGLLSFTDGVAKPAWSDFMAIVTKLESTR